MPNSTKAASIEVKDPIQTKSKGGLIFLIIVLVLFVLGLGVLALLVFKFNIIRIPGINDGPTIIAPDVEAFTDDTDFKEYLSSAMIASTESQNLSSAVGSALRDAGLPEDALSAPSFDLGEEGAAPERYSETNVQVQGVDEPDIVKTDGTNIFFSTEDWVYYDYGIDVIPEMLDEGISESSEPYYDGSATHVITAFPPAELEEVSTIDTNGDLLLNGSTLVVLNYEGLTGYDISDKENPDVAWQIDYDNSTEEISARLLEDKIYLITRTPIDFGTPCPMPLMQVNGTDYFIPCGRIYHPVTPVQTDVTYNAMVINFGTGEVEDVVSFVGSYDSAYTYMSTENLYVAYVYQADMMSFFTGFFDEYNDLVPDWVTNKLDLLNSYDISQSSKINEMALVLGQYVATLSDDDMASFENEFQNKLDTYHNEHKRELEHTGIVKINLDELEVQATGSVPGRPLNQFSFDEYEGNLRVATTVGMGFWGFGVALDNSVSLNDVYVLNHRLEEIGSVTDLGRGESIYAVRFIEDKGYVVTFEQVDPLYVIDFNAAGGPTLVGELEIPGYSSYLHPISDDLLLGIGGQDWNVKVSLFDVSDPANPEEVSKYTLNEYWTDAASNHHAFLLDTEHQVFFIPGSDTGYVFSYEGNELSLVKTKTNNYARRAIYIDDYLYIIGDDRIDVINENDWTDIGSLTIGE